MALNFSCEDDGFPAGLYGYQVERLLHQGDQKTWKSTESSVLPYLLFKYTSDSVEVYGVYDNVSDTLFIGSAKASDKSLIFTDSLLFGDGSYWLIESVSATYLRFKESDTMNLRGMEYLEHILN
jgi:hypothetical protein